MKKVLLITTFLLLFINNCSYASYNGWNLLSTRRNLNSIIFISDSKGWIFGGDIAYKTNDGGLAWSYPIRMNYNIGEAANRSVHFIDSLYGWSARNDHYLLRTTNGGDYWTSINTFVGSEYRLYAVYFVNRLTGWAVGDRRYYIPAGAIIKTTDGGMNWFTQNSNIYTHYLISIYMLNENTGFVSGRNTDTIGITTNGGNNWTTMKMGHGLGISRIWFLDSLNGWALGESSVISRTTNSGINWSNHYSFPGGNTTNFYFLDNLTGWITKRTGGLYKTTDGGLNYFIQFSYPATSPGTFTDIYFKNENRGWLINDYGGVFKSTNGGTNWNDVVNPPIGDIYSMYFFDVSTGWLTSNRSGTSNGYIYRTTNGGVNWDIKYHTNESYLASLTFVNNLKGFVTANNGRIYKTSNGGNNWVLDSIGGSLYKSINFINENTGWACGEAGYIVKTTNGGINWIHQSSNASNSLNNIYFVNPLEGFIASDSGVQKSTNGGDNWNWIIPPGDKKYRTVQFLNSNTGFVIGNRYFTIGYYPYSQRLVLKTTNAGLSWEPKINITQEGVYYFNNLFFVNDNKGWIISSNSEIRKTTNGGENWFFEQSPINESFNCVQFVNEDIGWIGGDRGTVLTTNPLSGIQVISNKIPQKFNLKQNYPNPFNPVTKIGYDLVKNGSVELKIFDLLGREIASLVNERQNAGSYLVDWNASGYPSGVYFYTLQTRDYKETKKMLLLK